MKKTALILMGLTMIAKLIGFSGEILLSYFYGTSSVSDAYLISLTIPSVLFSLIGTGISIGYIPLYSNVLKEKGREGADRFTNNLIGFLLIISTIVVVGSLLFTNQIVKIFAAGFTGESFRLAVLFTRIAVLNIWFLGLIYIFNGYLQLKNDFISPAIMVIPFNIIIVISIFLSSKINVLVLSIGSTLAVVLQFLFLVPFLSKTGYRYHFVLDKKDPYLKRMFYLALPIILGTSVNQVNRLVDRSFASQIAVGGVSAINYAFKLDSFIQDIFVVTLVTILYPMISKMAAEGNLQGLKRSISEAIGGINLFVVPATIGALIFAEPIVELLFGRGAFDGQAVTMTSNALFFYSIGLVGLGWREVLSKSLYSLQDTKTPMINGMIAIGINLVLNGILSRYIGISGIALGTSISIIISTLLLFISFRRKVGSFGGRDISISFLKIVIASSIMGAMAKAGYEILLPLMGSTISLLLCIAIGAILYFGVIYFMKIKEVDVVVDALRKRFGLTGKRDR